MWTQEEKDRLVSLYPNHTDAELCIELNKTPGQIRGMKSALSLNQKVYKKFTDEEKIAIVDFYTSHPDEMSLDELAEKIGRPKTSISRIAKKLCLTNQSRSLTNEQIEKMKASYEAYRNTEYYINIVKPKQKELLYSYLIHNHPKGMLGKHHTKETRERMSNTHREEWNKKSKEERDEFAQRVKEWQRNVGHVSNENTYSRCRRGKREDIGGIFFRSRWEANLARLFNKFEIEWLYENKRFQFPEEDDNVISYCPDFYLPNLDIWVEVKGWMDDASVKRLERLKKYYPDEYEKLVIVDEKLYYELEKQYAHEIEKWEYKKEQKENDNG